MNPTMPARILLLLAALALLVSALGCDSGDAASVELYINEFMADNETSIPDEYGMYSDWIELYNASDEAVPLDGVFVTDSLKSQTQWALPASLEVEPGGFLVLWATGDANQGDLHLPFKLSKGGEEIGLYVMEGEQPTQIDAVAYGEQTADVASARETDGSDVWITTAGGTPGASNG
jgi:hypothetical protein